ncbi:hypothetical protein FRB93_000418 [Tulasnella sp. JGI-2019a]|nr:hypothetical protein FRB93_000418 [Tulasnella sp. JGI-2019a]
MPTGTPYSGHIPPYNNIRIDAFTNLGNDRNYPDELLLLTHTHSDHIQGLLSKSFGLPFYCTNDAQTMLANYEPQASRVAYDREGKTNGAKPDRPLAHLNSHGKTSSDGTGASLNRKLPKTILVSNPLKVEVTNRETVTVTAIDANHCPGSVMYLIEGERGAVLHTGDVRCEEWWINALKRNQYLRPYLASPNAVNAFDIDRKGKGPNVEPFKQLEAIYLDTACMFATFELPSKEEAVNGLIEMMARYPGDTKFFINTWTPGYEEAIIGIARSFRTKVHVDRYKYRLYTSLSEPIFKDILTTDPRATRFHACERFNKCDQVHCEVQDVIYVNPQDMPLTAWQKYHSETMNGLAQGVRPTLLNFALARHSSLPELKSLVGLFRPKRIVPNTVYPNLEGLDWLMIPIFFQDQLPLSAAQLIWSDMDTNGVLKGVDKAVITASISAGELISNDTQGEKMVKETTLAQQVEKYLKKLGFQPFWENRTTPDTRDDPTETDFSVHLKNRLSATGGGGIGSCGSLGLGMISGPGFMPPQQLGTALSDQGLVVEQALLTSLQAAATAMEENYGDDEDASTDDEKGLRAGSQEPTSSSIGHLVKEDDLTVHVALSRPRDFVVPKLTRLTPPIMIRHPIELVLPPTPPSEPQSPQRNAPPLDQGAGATSAKAPGDLMSRSEEHPMREQNPGPNIPNTTTMITAHIQLTDNSELMLASSMVKHIPILCLALPSSSPTNAAASMALTPPEDQTSNKKGTKLRLLKTLKLQSTTAPSSADHVPKALRAPIALSSLHPSILNSNQALIGLHPDLDYAGHLRPRKKKRSDDPLAVIFPPKRPKFVRTADAVLPPATYSSSHHASSFFMASSSVQPKPGVINMRRAQRIEPQLRTQPPEDPIALMQYRRSQKDQERKIVEEMGRNMIISGILAQQEQVRELEPEAIRKPASNADHPLPSTPDFLTSRTSKGYDNLFLTGRLKRMGRMKQ